MPGRIIGEYTLLTYDLIVKFELKKAFVPGRIIGEYTLLTYDLIVKFELNNLDGLIVQVNFENVFDSLSLGFPSGNYPRVIQFRR